MKKNTLQRIVSLVLLASMLLVFVPVKARAAEMQFSDRGIALLKQLEGFCKYPVADGGQYSVGYGSRCPDADYARYKENGITEAEAVTLMRSCLQPMQDALNRFLTNNGKTVSQTKFDALLAFTYNVGIGWMTGSSELRTAVLNGTGGNDFLYYFSRWSVSGQTISTSLVRRRLIEADLYLNGNYSAVPPSNFTYVLLDANGGTAPSPIQAYNSTTTAKVKVSATQTGYIFLGWYTAKQGGSLISDLDAASAQKTLYAHWQKEGSLDGVPANYKRVLDSQTSIYQRPGDTTAIGTLKSGTSVTITMDYVDKSGTRWGKMSSGWIPMSSTHQTTDPAPVTTRVDVTVTVTGTRVNVRTGPGTDKQIVGSAYAGQKIAITEVSVIAGTTWGKGPSGWLCLDYTNYAAVAANPSGDETAIATGTVVNCSALRIRKNAGVEYDIVGNLAYGTKVSIYERKKVGTMEWGRINIGWICMDYVKLDAAPADKPQETTPTTPTTPPTTPTTPTGAKTGTVINCGYLNVRSAPGAHNTRVTSLPYGTKVTISETTSVGGIQWAHIKEGWVSMAYIQLDYVATDLGDGVQGTVYNCTKLNVRKAPGTSSVPVGTLRPGTVVTIYEQTQVNGIAWGRIDQGWVCLSYIRLATGAPDLPTAAPTTPAPTTPAPTTPNPTTPDPTTPSTITSMIGRVTGTNSVRIRAGAGLSQKEIGSFKLGTVVVILERKTAEGLSWGRTRQGWICMSYVTLDPSNNVTFTGTVTNTDTLNIRSAAGASNALVGTYKKGAKVTVLETTQISGIAWGRTDKGWICLQYITR